MEVTNEPVADSQQFVRCRARYRDLDTILEAAPEGPKISFHDRQLEESESQGYSPVFAV